MTEKAFCVWVRALMLNRLNVVYLFNWLHHLENKTQLKKFIQISEGCRVDRLYFIQISFETMWSVLVQMKTA